MRNGIGGTRRTTMLLERDDRGLRCKAQSTVRLFSATASQRENRLPAAAFSNVELALSNECPRPSVQCIIGPWLVARIGGGAEDDSSRFGRRHFLKASAAASVAAALGPYIRTSCAAGSLSVGFWDHLVPGANAVLTKLCNEWAKKEKVDLKIDYISNLGLAIFSEARAKAGHDILALPSWFAPAQAETWSRSTTSWTR